MNPKLAAFLNHPAISKAYVTEQLYGNRSKTSTGKLANKIRGNQNRQFEEWELARLEQIRIDVMKDLCNP